MLVNTAYAYLAEIADAKDRAEAAVFARPDLSKDEADSLCQNRDEFDASLIAPSGRQAAAEKALLREIGAA